MIDTAVIKIKAGDGGDGLVSFRHEKFVEKGGPWGGDGGNGADLIVKVEEHQNTLSNFRLKREYKAQNGMPGMKDLKKGKSGEDLVIYVPRGTLIYNDANELIVDLVDYDQEYTLQKGGRGGLGNYHFKSSTNQTPYQYTKGEKRSLQKYKLELKLIADVGIIGMPSAGKSTLLNILTRSNAKTGAYHFTTLEPNLGVLHVNNFLNGIFKDIVLADIPGLIEGASEGKGLGHDFLRHIERTSILIHIIDGVDAINSEPKKLLQNYKSIRSELEKWNAALLDKDEIILINKADITEIRTLEPTITKLFKGQKILFISAYTGEGLPTLVSELFKKVTDHKAKEQPEVVQKMKRYTLDNLTNKRLINLPIAVKPKPSK